MNVFERVTGWLVVGAIASIVLVEALPHLVTPAAIIFCMVAVGRMIWFLTR